jgi:hypothetical protein
MTGTLTYAAVSEHQSELLAAAEKGRGNRRRRPHFGRRLPALPGTRRPRRAFA